MPGTGSTPSIWRRPRALWRGDETHPFQLLQREMDRLFDEFSGGFELAPLARAWSGDGVLVPDIDVAETDDDIQLSVELPGVDEKDVEVSLADGVLTITGEKKAETEKKGKSFHRIERSYGAFRRALALPVEIDENKVDAAFAKGVLKITIAKKPGGKSATRTIKISAD